MGQRSLRGVGLVALTSAAVIGLSVLGAGTAAAGGSGHGGSAPAAPPATVATGLDNPRQLSFTPAGDLLVAEAGSGGTQACQSGPEGGVVCFGASGAVTKVDRSGHQSRIISGLPSIADQDTGASAIGTSDVYGDGRTVSVLIGLGADPTLRPGLPAPGRMMGTLQQTTGNSARLHTVADLARYEADNDPAHDPEGLNSNPVGLLNNCGTWVVADAGGNDVLTVNQRGRIALLKAFPEISYQGQTIDPVPTSVAVGSDGAYYVSELTGFPFIKGLSSIYRIDRSGKATVYASNLTNVTDLAFNGRDLYAVQIANDGLLNGPRGSVVKVTPHGTNHVTISGSVPLSAPYGIAIRNGYAYVTTGSVAPDVGEVDTFKL